MGAGRRCRRAIRPRGSSSSSVARLIARQTRVPRGDVAQAYQQVAGVFPPTGFDIVHAGHTPPGRARRGRPESFSTRGGASQAPLPLFRLNACAEVRSDPIYAARLPGVVADRRVLPVATESSRLIVSSTGMSARRWRLIGVRSLEALRGRVVRAGRPAPHGRASGRAIPYERCW